MAEFGLYRQYAYFQRRFLFDFEIIQLIMAQEQKKQELPFQFVPEGGQPTNSSKDFTGKAVATYPNGQIYDGYYSNGLRQGKGKYTYSNGDIYNGEFKHNLKHGIGRLNYADKSQYYGEWDRGRKQGQGMFIYANKDVYSGYWVAGRKHGHGTYVFNATGMKFVGEWFQGKFLSGKWLYPNGTYFEGQFQNNKPKGAGVWHFSNGNVLEGTYDQLITTADDNSLQSQLIWAHQ